MRTRTIDHEIAAIAHTEGMSRLVERLRSERTAMREETDAAVLAEFPELAEHAEPAVRHQVIDATFRRVLHRLQGRTDQDAEAETHRSFGAAAAYAGVPMERLTAAYRIGARVGWAHIRRAVRELGLDGEIALLLADAQLAYVDELSSDSIDGYARAVESTRHRQARAEQACVDDVLSGRPVPELAARTGSAPGAALAVAVLCDDSDIDTLGHPRLLLGTFDGALVAIGRGDVLDEALAGRTAAIGPTVGPAALPRSFERARRLATLVTSGTLARRGVLRWDQELVTVIVHAAPDAAAELAAHRLGALEDASPERRLMLQETLAAWLDHPGRPQAIAEQLRLHPQTVRYRLARLRERLGDALDDPAARFELALALRCPRGSASTGTARG